jgi:hypothetical protein
MKVLKVTYPNQKQQYINNIINEEIKRVRKINYVKKIINEEIEGIFESKKTEELAMNALNKRQVPNAENLLQQFKQIDTTKNQILLPAIAKAYIEHPQIQDLRGIFEFIADGLDRNVIKDFVASKKGYRFIHNNQEQQFRDWMGLSEYIHGQQQHATTDVEMGDVEVDGEKPVWENEKFEVYDGRTKEKCIKYGAGGISGRKYSFCIGTPPAAMHQSYRDTQTSTFWYVFDKERSLDDPLHMVVVDAVDPQYAEQRGLDAPYLLTDANNSTGTISEFGKSSKAYIDYLKQNGLPVEKILVHEPHSEEEKVALSLLKQQNPSLDWFKNLGPLAQKEGLLANEDPAKLTYKLQSQYIGRGHDLSDEQFMYLWPNRKQQGAFNLLKQYVTTGKPLPESQFKVLTGQTNGQTG